MIRLRHALFAALLFTASPAFADKDDSDDDGKPSANAPLEDGSIPYTIEYSQSEFKPLELEVAADKKLAITVKNTGQQPIEFESRQLNREKIVQPGRELVIYLPPLKAGAYKYINDFHPEQKGFISVK